jgi:hypothetical protein
MSHEIALKMAVLRHRHIEILNVAGPRESKELSVYEWTLTMLRFFLNQAVSGAGSHPMAASPVDLRGCSTSNLLSGYLDAALRVAFQQRSRRRER